MSGGVLTQVGTANPYVPEYDLQWDVSAGLTSQTFYAQAVSPSARLADCSFHLSATLELASDTAIVAEPATATDGVTDAGFTIETNRDSSRVQIDPGEPTFPYAVVGQLVQARVILGPGAAFPANAVVHWQATGNTASDENYSSVIGHVTTYVSETLPTTSDLTFYWISATSSGAEQTITANINGILSNVSIVVFQPDASFQLHTNSDNPPFKVYDGKIGYGQNIPGHQGMFVTGSITTPVVSDSAGSVSLLQLVDDHSALVMFNFHAFSAGTDVGGFIAHKTASQLFEDDSLAGTFYATKTANANFTTSVTEVADAWGDSPSSPIWKGMVYDSRYFAAQDFIMYTPSPSTRLSGGAPLAIAVTLQKASWQFSYVMNRPQLSPILADNQVLDPRYFSGLPIKGTTIPFAASSQLPTWVDWADMLPHRAFTPVTGH